MRQHVRQHGLDHARRAEEVRVYLVHKLVPLGFVHRAEEVVSGIVDQCVDASFALEQFAHASVDRGAAGDVQAEHVRIRLPVRRDRRALGDIDPVAVAVGNSMKRPRGSRAAARRWSSIAHMGSGSAARTHQRPGHPRRCRRRQLAGQCPAHRVSAPAPQRITPC